MFCYIDHVVLGIGSDKITGLMNSADNLSSQILNELNCLSESISINGSNPSNKSEEINTSIENIKRTNQNTLNVFNHKIELYFNAVKTAHEYLQNEIGKI